VIKLGLCAVMLLAADDCDRSSSDDIQRRAQEKILAEGTAQTGMPAIKNFRERRLLKDILELRDQSGVATYTYLFSEQTGRLLFFCDSVGYGLPYATQYTNPQKVAWDGHGSVTMPQADPNGLFSPADAEGTWVMCADPSSGQARPVYVEPRVVVSPFKLGS
jgi:hypothetical protein